MSRIGWVGRGAMGAPMARRLEDVGHEVVALPMRAPRARRDVRAAVGGVDAVFTCLPGPAEVADVWAGPDGLLGAVDRSCTLVDVSTIGPAAARDLADQARERGIEALDCPVSGGPTAAGFGSLSLMVGATSVAAVDRILPVLKLLGTVHRCGGPGNGQLVKLVNQSVLAGVLGGIGLGFGLTRRAGVDPGLVHEVLSGGVVRGFLLDAIWPLMEAEELHGGFAAQHMVKDIGLARTLAVGERLPAGLLDVVEQWLRDAMEIAGEDVATQAIAKGILR